LHKEKKGTDLDEEIKRNFAKKKIIKTKFFVNTATGHKKIHIIFQNQKNLGQ